MFYDRFCHHEPIMQGPLLLPLELAHYQLCADDKELFKLLRQKVPDLILFFKSACEDEKWALRHFTFIRTVLRWAAKQFYLDNLSLDDARCFVKIIQSHDSFLHPFLFFQPALFFTIKIQLKDEKILVNSLLFGVGSPVLRLIFKNQCFGKLKNEWTLDEVESKIFRLIQTYFYQGSIPELSKYKRKEISNLMEQAKRWEIQGLVKDCAALLDE